MRDVQTAAHLATHDCGSDGDALDGSGLRRRFLKSKYNTRCSAPVENVQRPARAAKAKMAAYNVTGKMPLPVGTRLGPYEVLAAIGAGGMGEVYRARDTRLDRTVAIKVLPAHLSQQPEVCERFEREARAVSALSHPNICALFDVGQQDGTRFLVMEYLEGETLAARLDRGALPLEQALRIAIQVAEALEKAHRQGFVHRDLKPGNVMLTKSGAKLLDFGLAKATGLAPTVSDFTSSPTVSRPLTAEGTIVGTFQYMSPEQLEGKETDARGDIFAFGAVLYEMLTGRKAFDGRSQASLIAAILEREPPSVSAIAPMAPPALARVVSRCLAKDPDERWQSAHDLRVELQWILEGGSQAGVPAPVAARRKTREQLAWALAAAALVALAIVATLLWRRVPGDFPVVQFEIATPKNAAFVAEVEEHNLAVSPDGSMIAFVAGNSGMRQLWLRRIDSTSTQPLAGTEGAGSPFWSPNGAFIGFFADGKMRKVAASGGSPQIVCTMTGSNASASWRADGTILFSEFQGRRGIFKVPAGGGEPELVLQPRTETLADFRWPHWLPGGKRFLVTSDVDTGIVYVVDFDSRETRQLLPLVTRVEYAAGHLFYMRERVLQAQPFDPETAQFTGEPIPVVEPVPYFLTGWAPFSVSAAGVLAYQRGESYAEVVWLNREGQPLTRLGGRGGYSSLALSADGRRAVVEIADAARANSDLWIFDVERGVSTRLTSEPGYESKPVWSPDGSRIAYGVHGRPVPALMVMSITGGAAEKLVPPNDNFQFPSDWSRDGMFLAYDQFDRKSGFDAWAVPLSGDRKPFPLVQTKFNESRAKFSPDGRWIAYVSDESGRSEVYVRRLRAAGEAVRVSTSGGSSPQWRRDGKELFYLAADGRLMSVSVSPGRQLSLGTPTALFHSGWSALVKIKGTDTQTLEVTPDGQRFLAITGGDAESLPITVVMNWKPEKKK